MGTQHRQARRARHKETHCPPSNPEPFNMNKRQLAASPRAEAWRLLQYCVGKSCPCSIDHHRAARQADNQCHTPADPGRRDKTAGQLFVSPKAVDDFRQSESARTPRRAAPMLASPTLRRHTPDHHHKGQQAAPSTSILGCGSGAISLKSSSFALAKKNLPVRSTLCLQQTDRLVNRA